MSYHDFLEEFAKVQGVGSTDTLLRDHAIRYSFQINSRKRAKGLISVLRERLGMDFKGKKILDVGCAYGSFSIELAKLGAEVVGIDISDKWLKLADVNARDEVEVAFLNCDASSRKAKRELEPHGPFDLIVINDVLEHIYDTAGLLSNLDTLLAKSGLIYYKVPNGHATGHVLSEGHKKVFGIALLAPDYWQAFVKAPFHIYYRRWEYFDALFTHFGLTHKINLNEIHDTDIEQTRRHVINGRNRIRRHLKAENFEDRVQFAYARRACMYYFEELETDVEAMAWEELFRKYRTTFWEGILEKKTTRKRATKNKNAK